MCVCVCVCVVCVCGVCVCVCVWCVCVWCVCVCMWCVCVNMYTYYLIIQYKYLLTAIVLSPGGSGYFTCIQNMKLVTNKFKSGGLHEKHEVATWNVGNHLSICL